MAWPLNPARAPRRRAAVLLNESCAPAEDDSGLGEFNTTRVLHWCFPLFCTVHGRKEERINAAWLDEDYHSPSGKRQEDIKSIQRASKVSMLYEKVVSDCFSILLYTEKDLDTDALSSLLDSCRTAA